ncbi:MAG: secretion system protein [Thermoproteus sp. JCHS_4]|jgi:Flp pilus assembly protein TadB|nr:MAG: secretion system protein [Thermoproteus sp. JCHS_4]
MPFPGFLLLAASAAASAAFFAAGYRPYRRAVFRARLEAQMPEALRAIADAVSGGLDLRSAFNVVASLGVSPIADVFRRVVALSSVGGATAAEALWAVAEELDVPSFKRLALIVVEAARSGARLPEVLGTAARTFATVIEFRRDLAAQLRPYVLLYYAVVGLFAVLSDVLIYFLLPRLSQLSASITTSTLRPAVLNAQDALAVLLLTAIAQALVGGLIVGRVVYFDARAGLVHASLAAALSSAVLLAPLWMS